MKKTSAGAPQLLALALLSLFLCAQAAWGKTYELATGVSVDIPHNWGVSKAIRQGADFQITQRITTLLSSTVPEPPVFVLFEVCIGPTWPEAGEALKGGKEEVAAFYRHETERSIAEITGRNIELLHISNAKVVTIGGRKAIKGYHITQDDSGVKFRSDEIIVPMGNTAYLFITVYEAGNAAAASAVMEPVLSSIRFHR